MDTRTIIANLRSERQRIDKAIAAMEAIAVGGAKPFRQAARQSTPTTARRRRRSMSAAARKKMSALMKARWASGKMGKAKKKAKTE